MAVAPGGSRALGLRGPGWLSRGCPGRAETREGQEADPLLEPQLGVEWDRPSRFGQCTWMVMPICSDTSVVSSRPR